MDLQKILTDHREWTQDSTKGKRADLSGAYLSGANLSRAYLRGANLSRAYLSGADLSGAYLSGADLSGAYLRGAYLRGANLSRAYLSGANLSRADLSGANQKTIDHVLSYTSILPSGELIVYKAANSSIVTLKIPAKARRVNYIGSRKCRAEFAKVMAIVSKLDGSSLKFANGLHNQEFIYTVGKTVRPDSYDPSPLNECSYGIHFFLTEEEAMRWNG
jgi:uncharacterized protein YjbI with pentapeptide repeats